MIKEEKIRMMTQVAMIQKGKNAALLKSVDTEKKIMYPFK